jgi:hypothetical protein
MHSAGLRTLVGVSVLVGATIGLVEVSVAAFSQRAGSMGAAGVLLALWSLGSMGGGLWYGGRRFSAPIERRYLVLAALVTAGLLPVAVVGALPLAPVAALAAMGLALVVAGAAIAPLLACHYLLVDRLAPEGTVTEAFNWALAGFLAGLSAGTAAAGGMIDGLGVGWALAAAPGAMTLAAALAALRHRTLLHPPEAP